MTKAKNAVLPTKTHGDRHDVSAKEPDPTKSTPPSTAPPRPPPPPRRTDAAPVAVRLALADDPWPPRRSRSGLEEAAASRLSAAIVTQRRPLGLARLRARAERLLGHAVVAYMKARALEGAALGVS
jgi:hypothetical protein